MRATRPRATAFLTTAGAALAVAAAIYAPVAAADDTIACEPGQIVIDGNCNVPGPPPQDDFAPPASDFFAPVDQAPMDGGNSVDIGGGGVDVGGGHR
jgi:hypothetical protein